MELSGTESPRGPHMTAMQIAAVDMKRISGLSHQYNLLSHPLISTPILLSTRAYHTENVQWIAFTPLRLLTPSRPYSFCFPHHILLILLQGDVLMQTIALTGPRSLGRQHIDCLFSKHPTFNKVCDKLYKQWIVWDIKHKETVKYKVCHTLGMNSEVRSIKCHPWYQDRTLKI